MTTKDLNLQTIPYTREHSYNQVDPNPDKNYYVYLHIDPKTQEIFYVGKGSWNRANEHSKRRTRNPKWFNRSLVNGVKVELVKDRLLNSQACELEKEIIWKLKDSNICNTQGTKIMPTSAFNKRLVYLLNKQDWTDEEAKESYELCKDPRCTQDNKNYITLRLQIPNVTRGGRARLVYVYDKLTKQKIDYCGSVKDASIKYLGNYNKKNSVIYNLSNQYYFSKEDLGQTLPF